MEPEYTVRETIAPRLREVLTASAICWIAGIAIGIALALAGAYARSLVSGSFEAPVLHLFISIPSMLAFIGLIICHELIHATVALRTGNTYKLGIGHFGKIPVGPACFVKGTFTRRQFLCVCLAPMLIISCVLLPILLFFPYYTVELFALHLCACGGDVLMALRLKKHSDAKVLICDDWDSDIKVCDSNGLQAVLL